jgi:Polysaccharide lyase
MRRPQLEPFRLTAARGIAYGVLMLAGVGAGLVVGLSPASAAVGWRGDYETGDWAQWGSNHVQTTSGATAAVESDTVRQGRYAAVFRTPASNERARSQVFVGQDQADGYDGHEVWYAWSSMIAPGSVLETGGWNNLTSWHHTGNVCPAPMHVAVTNNGGAWNFRLDAWGGPLNESTCSNPYRKTWNLGSVSTGRWYDFVVHVKWSADPNVGFVEVFVNGRRVLAKTNAATLYSGQGVYLKQGYDTGGSSGSTTVYNDGTVVAGSYAAALAAFPAGSWPAQPDGATTAAGTTSATTATTTTTSSNGSTTTSTPPPTATTTTSSTSSGPAPASTTATAPQQQSGPAASNGKKDAPPGRAKAKDHARSLAAVRVVRPAWRSLKNRYVRVISTSVSVHHALSVRVSVSFGDRRHGRLPLLAHSRVGGLDINYWRKTVITGPVHDGRVRVRLRVPRRLLTGHGVYEMRVRVVHPTSVSTTYLHFTTLGRHRG